VSSIQTSILTSTAGAWLWAAVLAVAFLVLFAAVVGLFMAAAIVVRRQQNHRSAGVGLANAVPSTIAELIPDSRYLNVNGITLHYVQAGEPSGGDIVLLHGIGASIFIWRFLFPILQARHRVTAFDLAGFGKSSKDPRVDYGLDAQAELINEALTKIGVKKAMLVGSSMGGAIALWMAKRWPERFDHVVGVGPATGSSLLPGIAQYFAATAPLFRHSVNERTMKLILGYVVSNKALITESVIKRYLEPFRDRGESLRSFVAATAILADRRLPRGLAGLKARTLIIWGTNDYLVSRKSMAKLVSTIPSAIFVDHPTGGHHIMEDEPVWLARKLELFLSGDHFSTTDV
jgi:pimeloyl-ACP methyl ester carboxylesterase